MAATPTIGTLRESSLHASLKELYARPGDELEAVREGYVVDLVARATSWSSSRRATSASLRPKLDGAARAAPGAHRASGGGRDA